MSTLTDLGLIKTLLKAAGESADSEVGASEFSIDLTEILLLVGCYRVLERNRKAFIPAKVLEKTLRLKDGTLRATLDKLDARLPFKLWSTTSKGRRLREGKDVEDFIRHCDNIVNNLAYLRARDFHVPCVTVGVSPELTRWIVPEVIRRFRLLHPTVRFQVEIVQKLPDELLRLANFGAIDLVVCSNRGVTFGAEDDVSKMVELPLHLLIDRRHKLVSKQKNVRWTDLREMTIVLQRSRSDEIHYAFRQWIPKTTHVVEVDTYAEAYAMVLAGGGTESICCAGFPQIMSPERRARFFAFRPPKVPKIQFLIRRSVEAREKRSDGDNKIVDQLFEAFHETLHSLELDLGESDDLGRVLAPNMRRTWHVHNTVKGERIWIRGELSHLVVTPDGYLRSDHAVQAEEGEVKFTVSGHITRSEKRFHIAWRGWQRLKNPSRSFQGFNLPPEESYVVSLAGDSDCGPLLIGHWLGRNFGQTYAPDFGYFVLADNDAPPPSNNALKQFEIRHRKLQAALPTKMIQAAKSSIVIKH